MGEEKLRDLINSNKTKSITIDDKKYWIGKKFKEGIKEKEKEGGVIPLLALIPAIAAGIASVAGTAGGIATAVNQGKQAHKVGIETEKVKEELAQLKSKNHQPIKKGSGLYLNPYQGKGINDFLKNQIEMQSGLNAEEKHKLKETCKSLKKGCICKIKENKHGYGIFLKPYKD